MEIRQLRYFEALARTLNFSRAAELLHIAQPALSRQIRQLEDELGVVLVDRDSRPIRLTDAGRYFHDQCLQVLAQLKEIQNATRRLAAGGRRWMGVGFVPSALYGCLPGVVRQFSLDNEHLDVGLHELTSIQQVEALNAGRIDVGFGRLVIPDPRLEHRVLADEPLVAAVQAQGVLGQRERLSLAQLQEEVLILYPAAPRPSFADQILQHFTSRGLQVGRCYETNGLQTALGLVAAGLGVTFIPASVQRLQREEVVYRPLSDPGLSTPFVMSVRRSDASPHVLRFCKAMESATAASA